MDSLSTDVSEMRIEDHDQRCPVCQIVFLSKMFYIHFSQSIIEPDGDA